MKKIWDWLVKSSANPRETSLTVKSVLLGVVPTILHFVTVACGFGIVCLGVDSNVLNEVVQVIVNIVLYGLSIISGIMFLVGFVRKITLTVTGKNKVINK